jgi:hypothetical protein
MNIKALITTLVLAGSSSVAMAKPAVTIKGSASVSIGSAPTTVVVRDHRAPAADCHDTPVHTQPVYTQPVPVAQPYRPIYQEPFFNPQNTVMGSDSSTYIGTFGRAPAHNLHRTTNAYGFAQPNTWFQLTEATRIDRSREFFKLQGQGGFFTKVRLQNLGGRTDVVQVTIEYKSGSRTWFQKVAIDRALTGRAAFDIHLESDSRNVNRIIVYGASGHGSAYQLLAM